MPAESVDTTVTTVRSRILTYALRAALAEDVPGGYLYFALLVARVAGAMLVEASGSKAQAAALVNE
jgi:hypothetical protein